MVFCEVIAIIKTSGNLWKYYRDEPPMTDAGTVSNFSALIIIVLLLNLNKKQQV